MAISGDTLLDRIGDDLFERILSDSFLQYVPVLRRDRGDIDNQIENALKGHLLRDPATEKSGAFIGLQLLDVSAIRGDAPTPVMEIRPVFECSENILVNQGAYGTGISAAEMVGRLTQLLHGMHLADLGTGLRLADANPVRTLALPTGQRGYEVEFVIDASSFARVSDVAQVSIAIDAGEVTLATTTSGATIYYTTDGSYPGSGNANATAYSAPFSPGSGITVRAAAEKADMNPSKYINCETLP